MNINCIADATLSEEFPANNYGADDLLCGWTFAADERRCLMAFPLAGVPAEIVAATLTLVCKTASPAARGLTIVQLDPTKDFQEASGTWNQYKAGSDWDIPGGDFDVDGEEEAGLIIPTLTGPIDYDVTTIVQNALAAEKGIFWAFLTTGSGGMDEGYATFYSRETITPSLRPLLSIETDSPGIAIYELIRVRHNRRRVRPFRRRRLVYP